MPITEITRSRLGLRQSPSALGNANMRTERHYAKIKNPDSASVFQFNQF
jgi:hypothetical protein